MGLSLRTVILDASAAIPWLVPEQSTAALDALFQEGYQKTVTFIVPSLWWFECANVLKTMVHKKRLVVADAQKGLHLLRRAHPKSERTPGLMVQKHILALACTYDLSYYDATYLELALRRNSQLATLDNKLRTAAKVAGVLCLDLED